MKDHNEVPLWKIYEQEIHNKLTDIFEDCHFEYDDYIFGKFSKTDRQIDISVRGKIGGNEILGLIDCKHLNKKIDVKTIESILGMMEDVRANFGIIITNKGYSKAAKNRAAIKNLKLDIIELDNLNKIQITYDYFINQRIRSLELSKFEFFRRSPQNTAFFDKEKSSYKKRTLIFKEKYVTTEKYIHKKFLESAGRWFRDFTDLDRVTIKIPLIIKDEPTWEVVEKRLYEGVINRYQLEKKLGLKFESLKEDIELWRSQFLNNEIFKTENLTKFMKPLLSYKKYNDYEKDVW